MRLKTIPEDFRVRELLQWNEVPGGAHVVHLLHKEKLSTPEALAVLVRDANVDRGAIAYAGLKDRQAVTDQYVTIERRAVELKLANLRVQPVGTTDKPLTSRMSTGNAFTVVVRDLAPAKASQLRRSMPSLLKTGFPNYFDDQRFGSVTADGKFVAKELVSGRFKEALKLALTGEYEFDRADQKEEKRILLAHWGDWPECKAKLPKGHARSLVTYLCDHPTKFKGAVTRLRPELQGLYLSAYQSELWNRMLTKWLTANFPADALGVVRQHRGPLPVPNRLPADVAERWNRLLLPLPSPRLKPEPAADWLPHLDAVLAEEQLTLKQLKIPGVDRPFFSKGERFACLRPTGMTAEPGADELNRGKRKVTLRFDLPRGAYATMVVKRLTGSDA